MKEEIWASIIEYPGYQFSTYGRVKCKDGSIKKIFVGGKERVYFTVKMYVKGVSISKYLHRLIAETFIENTFYKKEVNHKDCNKSNNNVENLEWCTREENMVHARINNRLLEGERATSAKLTNKQVIEIRELKKKNPNITNKEIGKMYGLDHSNISRLLRRKFYSNVL